MHTSLSSLKSTLKAFRRNVCLRNIAFICFLTANYSSLYGNTASILDDSSPNKAIFSSKSVKIKNLMSQNGATIVEGGAYGDEGKGKLVDILSSVADSVVRSQGGNNAGHTVKCNGKTYKFHLVPSAVLNPNVKCFIAGGVVLDPKALLKEFATLEEQGVTVSADQLKISPSAHVILPHHCQIDKLSELAKGSNAVGTTGRGIGPCYAEKASRDGLRFGDFFDETKLAAHINKGVEKAEGFRKYLEQQGKLEGSTIAKLDSAEIFDEYKGYAEKLKAFLDKRVEAQVAEAIESGQLVLLEGAQGVLLDNTFGSYPFVTSSSTSSAGIAQGAGISPLLVGKIIKVVKAYITRVGNGPLPTHISEAERVENDIKFADPKVSGEFGTTTGRARTIGWFDAVLLKHSIRGKKNTTLAVMKLDCLDNEESLKICTEYKDGDGQPVDAATVDVFSENLFPVYEQLPGWKTSTRHVRSYDELPENAKRYIERIEELAGCPVEVVSVGPDREETIIRELK